MYLIVVGAGPIGRSVVELALEDGHDLTLIEADGEMAERMAERFDARVLHASIAEGEILEEADAARADALVATTTDDSANLMAMVLGLEAEIGTLVSVVNEGHHRRLFERLGVHVLLDPETIVARYLYGLLRRPEIEESVALPSGGLAFELELHDDAPLVGRTIPEAHEQEILSPDVVVVWVRTDGGEPAVPAGDLRLESGHRLTVFSPGPLDEEQLAAFGLGSSAAES